MDIGAHLRGARERRGLTIEQVASSTKLSTHVLRSIEHNEWDRLPGGLVTRGHLRAVAAAIGVEPEAVVREYVAQLPARPIHEAPVRRAPAIDYRTRRGPLLIAAIGVVLFGVLNRLGNSPPAPPVPTTANDPVPAARQPSVAQDEAAEVVPAAEPRASVLSLVMGATGPCWVSARADGRVAVYRLLEAGEAVTVTAEEQLELRVGDPGMFTYTLNGAPGRSLGDVGQPISVTITQSNVQTFFAEAAPGRSPIRQGLSSRARDLPALRRSSRASREGVPPHA